MFGVGDAPIAADDGEIVGPVARPGTEQRSDIHAAGAPRVTIAPARAAVSRNPGGDGLQTTARMANPLPGVPDGRMLPATRRGGNWT